MTREIFKKQINMLISEYADKNFNMPKDRALQWYERFKDVSDEDFTATVGIVLDTCSFAPCMADLVKAYAQVREEKSNRAPKKWEGSL